VIGFKDDLPPRARALEGPFRAREVFVATRASCAAGVPGNQPRFPRPALNFRAPLPTPLAPSS
jgi:hypothetical protein